MCVCVSVYIYCISHAHTHTYMHLCLLIASYFFLADTYRSNLLSLDIWPAAPKWGVAEDYSVKIKVLQMGILDAYLAQNMLLAEDLCSDSASSVSPIFPVFHAWK